jgi:hypothetical protein
MPAFSPPAAADELTRAIHDGRCHPYCRGAAIRSNLAPRLMVVARLENDGSWVARVENVAYTAEQPVDVWEFEIDEVRALLPRKNESERPVDSLAPSPRRRGPVVTHDWFSICGEIARRCVDEKTGRVKVPKRESGLAKDVLDWLAKSGKNCPAVSEMREAVKRVCARLREAQR